MNIFSALRVYAGKWSQKDVRPFTQEEIDAVAKAIVVESNYGYSVCFMLKSGGQSYIPLEDDAPVAEGDTIDLSKAKVVTLEKAGEQDINRVRI